MFKRMLNWLISLGERGEIGDPGSLDDEFGKPEKPSINKEQGDEQGHADKNTEAAESEGDVEEGKAEEKPPDGDSTEESGDDGHSETQPLRDQAWWEKRAKHFESEYKKERVKRQQYQKGGGLADSLTGMQRAPTDTGKEVKPLEQIDNVKELYERFQVDAVREAKRQMTDEQLTSRVVRSEAWARRHFVEGNEDGLPSYDEMMSDYGVYDFIDKSGIMPILKQLPNPAQAAYTLGVLLHPNLANRKNGSVERKAREGLVKNIEDATKKAKTIQGRSGRQGLATKKAADFDLSNPKDWEEFEREIQIAKNGR